MKKLIALFISASMMAAPVAFAADEQAGNQDAAMQQMTAGNDQAANDAAKPAAKKGHHPCHCKNCAHKHHHKSPAKKPAASSEQQ